MNIKYQLTIDDYVNAHKAIIKIDPKSKKKHLIQKTVWIIAFEFAMIILALAEQKLWVMFWGLAMIYPLWLIFEKSNSAGIKRKFKKAARVDPVYLSEKSIEVFKDKLTISALGMDLSIPLNAIERVCAINGLILYKANGEFRIIPIRAFPSETEKAKFIDALKQTAHE